MNAGVLHVPGDLFFCDRMEKNWARLSFGVLAPDLLREAAKRFAGVAKRFARAVPTVKPVTNLRVRSH